MFLEQRRFGRWIRGAILACCVALEGSLIRYNCFGPVAQNVGLLALESMALLLALVATGTLPVPRGVQIPFFGVWPRLSDSIKSATSFIAIFLWTPVARQLVPDTPAGVAIVLAPDALFLLAALVYLSNGLSKGTQR